MALPAMISEFGQQTANYGMSVGQSLQQLGQQVGQQLAMREYQKQAASALPAMQQQYDSAFNKIKQGDTAGGYMDVLKTNMAFGATQNPFLLPYINQASQFAEDAAKNVLSQGWQTIQAGRGAGGGGGGMGGGAYGAGMPGFDDAPLPEIDGETEIDAMAGVEEPNPQVQSQLSPQEYLKDLAGVEPNKEWAKALFESAETANDPDKQRLREAVQSKQKDWEKLSASEQKNKLSSRLFDATKSKQEAAYPIAGAERVIGEGIQGIYFDPGLKETGVNVGQSGKASQSFKKEDMDSIITGVNGAVSKLNEGDLGNFLSNVGGVFNTTLKTEEIKDRRGEVQGQVTKIVDNRNSKNEYIIPEELAKSVVPAYTLIKTSPGTMSVFKASDAGFLYQKPQRSGGPTRESARGLKPMRQISSRPPLDSILGRK